MDEFATSEKILRAAMRQGSYPEELAELTGSAEGNPGQLLVFLLSLRHGVRLTEARVAWCDEALKGVRASLRERTSRGGNS